MLVLSEPNQRLDILTAIIHSGTMAFHLYTSRRLSSKLPIMARPRSRALLKWIRELEAIQVTNHAGLTAHLNLVGTDVRIRAVVMPTHNRTRWELMRHGSWSHVTRDVAISAIIAQDNGEVLAGSKVDLMRYANGELLR